MRWMSALVGWSSSGSTRPNCNRNDFAVTAMLILQTITEYTMTVSQASSAQARETVDGGRICMGGRPPAAVVNLACAWPASV